VTALLVLALTLTALAGTAVVLTDVAERQAVTLSAFGLTLVLLLVLLQAPDVALSELALGTAVVPLMVMLTIRTLHKDDQDRDDT